MAIIICPECGKEISDKAAQCIHCGYPIADEKAKQEKLEEQKRQEAREKQMAAWDQQLDDISNATDEEKLPVFISIGEQGYWKGYNMAGTLHFDRKDYSLAEEYYNKALEITYDEETEGIVYNNLGLIYLVLFVNGGKQDQNYLNSAKNFFRKAIELNDDMAYANMGWLYYELDHEKNIIVAASYCFLAMKHGRAKNSYEQMLNNIHPISDRNTWKPLIESIQTESDINPMIRRGNELIKEMARNKNVVRCPTCGSTNVDKISKIHKATSISMFGIFSGKIGKTFKCHNCGYMW